MVIRKRLLVRLYYGKNLWRYKLDCRWVDSIPARREKPAHYIRGFQKEPLNPNVLFAYWFDGSQVTGSNHDDWGFRVLQDGQIIYTYGTICEKRREYEFQLPEACLSELRNFLEAHRTEYLSHRIGTNRIGVKAGWQDAFTFLGFRFSAWHIFRHPEALSQRSGIPQQYLEDCLQENWMLDIFDEGRAILESYGFSAPFGTFSLRYITGIHALSIFSRRNPKDVEGVPWNHIQRHDAGGSFWGVTASIQPVRIPGQNGIYPVADPTQACLDLLELGDFDQLHGMCGGLIGLDEYSTGFFRCIMKHRHLPHWPEIDAFLEKEYPEQWPDYRQWYDTLPEDDREYAFQKIGMRDWKTVERVLAVWDEAKAKDILARSRVHPDLFAIIGLCILCKKHLERLSDGMVQQIHKILYYQTFKGFQQELAEYADATINRTWIENEFLSMLDRLGLPRSDEERRTCESDRRDDECS